MRTFSIHLGTGPEPAIDRADSMPAALGKARRMLSAQCPVIVIRDCLGGMRSELRFNGREQHTPTGR